MLVSPLDSSKHRRQRTTSTHQLELLYKAEWSQNGLTEAGGHSIGNGLNQLSSPWGVYVNDDETVYVADQSNHRIMEWKCGATSGKVVAGENGHQLNCPIDVVVDKRTDALIICDQGNRQVVRWFRRSVAGGNGKGQRLKQLYEPTSIFVDRDHSVYVSDTSNHRVMKWVKDAKEGIVVAGSRDRGTALTQLSYPYGLIVDELGTVYVTDGLNHRIMRWSKGATQGIVILGENGQGEQANQLNSPQ